MLLGGPLWFVLGHPNGLANASGLLGKYIQAHFTSGTWAMFDEDVILPRHNWRPVHVLRSLRGKNSQNGAFGGSFITVGSALKTSDLGGFANARVDLFGQPLKDFMKRAARGLTPCARRSRSPPCPLMLQ